MGFSRMFLSGVGVRRRSVFGVLTSLAVAAFTGVFSASPAEARHHHHHHHLHRFVGGGYHPPFSAIVVDAKAGKVLYAVDENELRHPASITKVMTLYLLFEQLEQRRDDPGHANSRLRSRRRAGADQAWPRPRRHHRGRRRDQGGRHAFGKRHGGRHRRKRSAADERRFRRHDDAQGARARHERHAFRQRLGPAQRRTDHDRARSRDPRRAPSRSASRAITAISRHAQLLLRRHGDPQPQPSPRPHRRHGRNQDRLHPRLRLQPADLCASRRGVRSSPWSWAALPPPGAITSWPT